MIVSDFSLTFLICTPKLFQCKLNVIEKELVVAPQFVQRFGAASVKEGEPVILSARAVGTPVPNISWQKVRINVFFKI